MSSSAAEIVATDQAGLLQAAAGLEPLLRAHWVSGEADRELSSEVVDGLKAAGTFRACQPARGGGSGLPFGVQTTLGAKLAETWGSVGWLASVIGTHHWIVGKFQHEAQERIWGRNPDAVVASAFASSGARTQLTDGGFRISGRWLFASGITFADWCMVLAPPAAEGAAPAFMLIPRSDFEVQDSWRSVGMRATGSHDIVVADSFVPDHCALPANEIEAIDTPGIQGAADVNYRLPFSGVVSFCVAAPALGLARAALAGFRADMSSRQGIIAGKLAANTNLQVRAAEAAAELDCAQLLYDAAIDRIQDGAKTGRPWDDLQISRLKRDASYIGVLCKRSVDRLAEALGAKGLQEDNPVQRAQRDLHAACAHISMVWDANAQPYGRGLLGLPPG